jgi:Na+-translocating ferredoxin:NAD+ oxidoreductase subunit B
LDAALPQTQCTRCGYADCHAYAQALAQGEAAINRCPPGGDEGVIRLAAITGAKPLPLDPSCGVEGARSTVVIDEAWCIGCTLCIKACPVDCIVGASKWMHTVIQADCTGCELCVPVCPVDCIVIKPATPGLTGWSAWSQAQADTARQQYQWRTERLARDEQAHSAQLEAKAQWKLEHLPELVHGASPEQLDAKRSRVEQAMARAREKRASGKSAT